MQHEGNQIKFIIIFAAIQYFLANKPTRRISRDQLLSLKMRVLPYYRPISRGRKFDLCGAAPD